MAVGEVWPIQALFATMQNINLFQYLAAFITIVLAIALTDLLASLHRLIIARRSVRWSVLPLAAAFFVFVSLVSEFFSIWVVADVKEISFAYLILLVAVPSTFALAAFTVLPDNVPAEGLDLGQAYLANHVYLYATLAVSFTGDLVRTIIHYSLVHDGYIWSTARFWWVVMPPTLGIIAVFVLLAWSRNWRVHLLGLPAIFAMSIDNYLGWTVG